MTQIKRSGILMYFDMKPVLERLSDHEVKELLLAILDYGENGVVPEFHSATPVSYTHLTLPTNREV